MKRDRAKNGLKDDLKLRVFFFAIDGYDFQILGSTGEPEPRRSNHRGVSIKEMLDWFMPAKYNKQQPYLKLFTRISLGI